MPQSQQPISPDEFFGTPEHKAAVVRLTTTRNQVEAEVSANRAKLDRAAEKLTTLTAQSMGDISPDEFFNQSSRPAKPKAPAVRSTLKPVEAAPAAMTPPQGKGAARILSETGADPFDDPVKLTANQKANEPVAPAVDQLAPTLEGDYTPSEAARFARKAASGQLAKQNFAAARPLYLGDLHDRLKSGDVKSATEAINDRVVESLADEFKLTPDQVREYVLPYREEQITAALPGLLSDLSDDSKKGYVAHPLPADYAEQLGQLRRLKSYEKMSAGEKADAAYAIAKGRPLTPTERKALGYDNEFHSAADLPKVIGNYVEAAGVGAAEGLSELAAGYGRISNNPVGRAFNPLAGPIGEFGEMGEKASRERENIVKPEGVGGELAKTGGRLGLEMAGTVVVPESQIAHAAYWAGLSATQSLGRGETPEQAAKNAAIAAGMIGASKPLAPLSGAAEDTFKEITVKAGARAAGGYALGYGLARSQGASDEDAHAQGLMFAGMNLAGGKRAQEEPNGKLLVDRTTAGSAERPAQSTDITERGLENVGDRGVGERGGAQPQDLRVLPPEGDEKLPPVAAPAETATEARHHSNFQPRDEAGQFVAGTPEEPAEPKYKLSSTQANRPEEHAAAIKTLGEKIPDEDLAADGRERQPHITVKYGLHGNDAEELRQILESEPPVRARLGKTSTFEGVEDGTADAVKLDVDSPDLHRLNQKIADALPHTDTHPDYIPHATVAYVKPGLGEKYSGMGDLEGREITLDRIAFSDRDGNQTEIELKGKPEATDGVDTNRNLPGDERRDGDQAAAEAAAQETTPAAPKLEPDTSVADEPKVERGGKAATAGRQLAVSEAAGGERPNRGTERPGEIARGAETSTPANRAERSLPKTLEAAQLDKGESLGYEPDSVKRGIDAGREIVKEKGVDGAIEHVLHGNAGIEWASTGYAAMEHLREQETALRATNPVAADEVAAKRLKFVSDFTEEATKRGQAIAGIRAIEEFAPDRAAYEANRLSQKNRKRPLSKKEDARITEAAEALQLARDRIKSLEAQLASKKASKPPAAAKPKKPDFQARLDEQAEVAKAALAARLNKLDFGNLSRASERGSVRVNEPALQGDAELLAQYAASRLGGLKTAAELNAEIVNEFGKGVEPHLAAIRRRAYAIRQEARVAEIGDAETSNTRRRTILKEIEQEIKDSNERLRDTELVTRIQKDLADREAAQAEGEANQDAATRLRQSQGSRRQERLQQKEAKRRAAQEADEARRVARIQEGMARDEARQAERERLAATRREYQEATKANKKAYRESIKAQRQAERTANLWDTPIRRQATEAKARLAGARPTAPETMEDLVSAAAEMLLPEAGKSIPRIRPLNPAKFYVDLKEAFPDLVTRKNQGEIYKRAFQRLQDTVTASREVARLASADAESRRMWEELGVDTETQAVMIRRAEAMRKQIENRARMTAEFNRVSRSRLSRIAFELQSLPRALQSSIDAPIGRQGLFYSVIRPVESARAMIPATWRGYTAGRHASFEKLNAEMRQHPDYGLAERSGLELTKMAGESDGRIAAEEEFQSSLAERLPHVRLSEQGYNAGMNAQRLTVFSRYADFGRSRGYTPESNPEFFKEAARRVNIFTGRGDLSTKAQNLTSSANWLLYSARLQVSRAQMLNEMLNPRQYLKADPAMRRIMAGEAIRTAVALGLIYGTAKAIGLKATFDPDDADFGKVVAGNTHYDISGGLGGTARLLVRLVRFAGQMATGDEGEKQKAWKDTTQVAEGYARQKLAPWPQFFISGLSGSDAVGKPTTWKKQAVQMVSPMIVGDLIDAAQQDGWMGLVKTAPGLAGFGVQNYEGQPPRSAGEKAVHRKATSNFQPAKPLVEADRARNKAKRELVDLIRAGKIDDAEARADAMLDAGEVSERELQLVGKRAQMGTDLKYDMSRLSVTDALDLYEDGPLSEDEKKQVRGIIMDKLLKLDTSGIRGKELPALQKRALKFAIDNLDLLDEETRAQVKATAASAK